MKSNHAMRTFFAAVLLCLQSMLAHASPEVGIWWNPAQSGRGFVIKPFSKIDVRKMPRRLPVFGDGLGSCTG